MNTVNVLFAGDFCPNRRYEPLILEQGECLLRDALGLIESSDIAFVNLECPLTRDGRPIQKIGPTMKAAPDCAGALTPFTLVGLANNHILDFGKAGLRDTIEACTARGIGVVGAGLSGRDAQRPFITQTKGVKVAIIAIAELQFNRGDSDGCGVALIDPIDNYRHISRVRQEADIVIVTFHGGNEHFEFPRPGLRKLCQYFIDIGADAVIGHHPHVPGAYEYYQGKPIVYSLGNLIFDREPCIKGWNSGYLTRLSFDVASKGFRGLELFPYEQSIASKGLRLLGGREREQALSHLEGLREKLCRHEAYTAEWNRWLSEHGDSYLLVQYSAYLFRGLGFLARHTPLLKLLVGNSVLNKLNMVRCPSHHEMLVAALEQKVASMETARRRLGSS
jgi:poly-gamma-glutamate synthesis protein (capsule biosynthesis protein)